MSHSGWADALRVRGPLRDGRRALRSSGAAGFTAALPFMGVLCFTGALGFSTAWSPSALAQTATASGSCAPGPLPAGASAAQEVAALYGSFECHFARKEYAACLPYLEQACQLTDSPRCPLNLGAVHHALMHCQLARGYYRQYLDRAPYDEDVAAARSALEELERACPGAEGTAALVPAAQMPPGVIEAIRLDAEAVRVPAAAKPPPLTEAPAQDRRASEGSDHVLAWSLLGAGGASLAATVTLAAFGARAERDYEARARRLDASERATDAELRAIDERGHRSNQAALVLGVLSGLLSGAGATLWLTEDAGLESAPGASVQLLPDGTPALSYSGRF